MSLRTILRRLAFCLLCCSTLAGLVGGTAAGPVDTDRDSVAAANSAVQKGAKLESSRQWLDAIEFYQEAHKQYPQSRKIEYGLRRAKIHFGIERRYADSSFRNSLLNMSRTESLALLDDTLDRVRQQFVDPISSTSYVAHGTESLYLALVNNKFVEKYLQGVSSEHVREMRRILRENYWNKPIADQQEARQAVSQLCDVAYRTVGLPSGAVVMEYVFGGCNALDDYSSFLTPERLEDLYDNIDGEFVGLGVEMKAEIGKGLLLVNVLPESPAEEAGVLAGAHIISIDGMECVHMTTDAAAGLLRGPSGSRVRLVVTGPDQALPRTATLVRRAVQVKSFPVAKVIDSTNGIAYLQMTGFQKSSARELDTALDHFRRQGVRAVIWDVRGNPGGLLTASVEVLDRFIDEGVLVSTRGRTRDQNWTYSAHRFNTEHMPMVLLVDGNSASASEIVAGAIQDHGRGTIIGRQTYGKWSVQSIFPVHKSCDLRITTAKFYSPHGRTLGKVGLRPDTIVDASDSGKAAYRRPKTLTELGEDADVQKGLEVLRRQFARR